MANNILTKSGDSFILIDFSERLNNPSKFSSEMYCDALNAQYNKLTKRIPEERVVPIEDFFKTCFPTGLPKKYYISCPNFVREKQETSNNVKYLNNLVIRPELTPSMKKILPDNQNIFILGDIVEGSRIIKFNVKGIEFIDENMSSPNDFIYEGPAYIALSKKTIPTKNGTINVADFSIGHRDFRDCIFTHDNIDTLIKSCYTVKEPEKALAYYDKWMSYFEARAYYLSELAKERYEAATIEFIHGFAITKEVLRSNPQYDGLLLSPQFKHSSAPLIKKEITESSFVPVVKMSFLINKQEASQDTGKNSLIRRIRRLANSSSVIFKEDPISVLAQNEKNRKYTNPCIRLERKLCVYQYDVQPTEGLARIEDDFTNRLLREQNNLLAKKSVSEKRFAKEIITDQIPAYLSSIRVEPKVIHCLMTCAQNTPSNEFFSDKWINTDRKKIENILGGSFKIIGIEAIKTAHLQFLKKYRELIVNHRNNLEISYSKELADLKNRLQLEKQQQIDVVIDRETNICLEVYFKTLQGNNPKDFSDYTSKWKDFKFFSYDTTPERAKLDRQKEAITGFYKGYVKNPYLSTYLFSPEDLNKQAINGNNKKWEWFLPSQLNEKQQEAVKKAVESNGLFLLQGPPGTGKTQVIAEIVSQYVARGQKVLISSETHKAIDNVFERLPKRVDIVPVRLLPNYGRKQENDYDPLLLVDNFYNNIRVSMNTTINRFKNFAKLRDSFQQEMNHLKMLRQSILARRKEFDSILQQIDKIDEDIAKKRDQLESLVDKEKLVNVGYEKLKRTQNAINLGFGASIDATQNADQAIVTEFFNSIKHLLDLDYIASDKNKAISLILTVTPDEINEALNNLNPNSEQTTLELRKEEIKRAKASCLDEFDEVLPEKQEIYNQLQSEFKQIVNRINTLKNTDLASNNGGQSNVLKDIFAYKWIMANQSTVIQEISRLRTNYAELKAQALAKVSNLLEPYEKDRNAILSERKSLSNDIAQMQNQINELNDSELSQNIQKDQRDLSEKIRTFMTDFDINKEWNTEEDAFSIMEKEWFSLCQNAKQKEQENKERIPMYQKIVDYLADTEVVKQDRNEFTDDLFNSANVYGITCTSRERFFFSNDTAELIGLDKFNLKESGIDVVIIDEVSKSSFVDMLIPIMYGKTVVLVGDHRQLNPMYDLAKLRDENFESLDPSKFNKDINSKLQRMYEISYFKNLFEKISDDYKVMLNQQYRCHESIMKVFNHFYRNELKIGFEGQNNMKQHFINLTRNGINIIRPDKNVYFINCHDLETKEDQDATSFINPEEAIVIESLIKQINDYFLDEKNAQLEKLSFGVISTYGAQAGSIKAHLKGKKLNGFITKGDEKPIVSTVDDFQGDERDIIFLSMVRNNRGNFTPEFISNYQRINVALSRARRLLIIVGNKDYLIRRGVIDLPDVYGRKEHDQKNFRMFERVISTIEQDGKILDSSDIIDRNVNNHNFNGNGVNRNNNYQKQNNFNQRNNNASRQGFDGSRNNGWGKYNGGSGNNRDSRNQGAWSKDRDNFNSKFERE